ncbi:MAG: EutN/CcmL family microcompartment protein [Bacillota bacterium]
MLMARVVGNVISTVKEESHYGCKLLIIEFIGLDKKPYGARSIVMDAADAGVGDIVLVNVDGGSSIMIMGDGTVVDWTVCGVVDHFSVGDDKIDV